MAADGDVAFEDHADADLVVDRIYKGGRAGNRGDDPIARLLPVGNSGGFRFLGSPTKRTVRCLVLYTSMLDPDWPDVLDLGTGTFTYYGDNKHPGKSLHETPRKGNLALSQLFADSATVEGRAHVPPILLFSKGAGGADVRFRGLLVPGSPAVPLDEQLVAIWRSTKDQRFQNYRAAFSVLNVPTVSREWLTSVTSGAANDDLAPPAWRKWRLTGIADRLLAPRELSYRSRDEQLPADQEGRDILSAIHSHFALRPHDFEQCAAQLWMMLAPATEELIMTQRSRDGGRDAIGRYRIGPPADLVRIDFALEAKCYAPHNSVGVREVSRLISRLRHRQFGVLVTTSFVHKQAYSEIRDDQHPVAIVSGSDIVQVLRQHGFGSVAAVRTWLDVEFPAPPLIDVVFQDSLVVDLEAAPELAARSD